MSVPGRWSRGQLTAAAVCAFLILSLIGSAYRSREPIRSFINDKALTASSSANIAPSGRVLVKVGGVPQEGFGSSLHFIKDGIRMAKVLDVDFYPVRTFDFDVFEYNAMDELNLGIDSSKRNWNNMCNLHTSITKVGGHEPFPERVVRLRKGVERFIDESKYMARGEEYDEAFIQEVRQNVEGCDVIIYADQEVHQDWEWDDWTRAWVATAIRRNAAIKLGQGKAKPIPPRDVHVHYRWGDVVDLIQKHHDGGKWNFDNAKLERSIASVEACLRRKLTSNVFIKHSPAQESDDELRQIIAPIRQDASIIEGEDDIVDLYHLSQAKILAVSGGTYSSAAAATGNFSLVIHNGWHVGDYEHLYRDGVPLLEQGEKLSAEQCAHVRRTFPS
ncbi:hypothetical protein G647_10363 [Cladophialophora carrionii CBS 160.54]|uniref:Uncharacterized protein n=1 Tax=Cladophialophora carrionii CBS 160.54 TaxID=1279043 RepID=V9DK58_9EURO|nr:uncharacterized protein G647_10363 [Cladophialophora carrionii CBS 160.54]ETI26703.1 hypothetical protein G647_10363 [Cladophialophora carrionii CBS 160.54]